MTHIPSMTKFSPRRREVLLGAAAGAAALAVAPGGLTGIAQAADVADAASYPAKAFAQTTETAALKMMYGAAPAHSADVKMGAPDIAENGAVVPVTVDSSLPSVTAVALLAIDNPFTMAAAYKIQAGTNPGISSRLKLAKTTKVVAVVQSGGKLYSTSKPVKVTLGGCG